MVLKSSSSKKTKSQKKKFMDISADVISPTGFRFSNEDLYEMKQTEEDEEADKASEANETASKDTPVLSTELVQGLFNVYDRVRGKKTLSERLQKQKEIEEEIASRSKNDNINRNVPKKKEEQPCPSSLPEKTVEKEVFTPKQDERLKIPQEIESPYKKMQAFFSVILRVLQSSNVSLDTHARFGVELFLAGACEHLCRENELTTEHHQLMFSNILHQLGRSFSAAEKFFNNLDEYTLDAQNLSMVISGANGMRIYYKNRSSPELISLFLKPFNKWLRPEEEEAPLEEKRTVMFTDMISSTQTTQMLGDRMAQHLVRSHNAIIRKALQIYGGTEIKQSSLSYSFHSIAEGGVALAANTGEVTDEIVDYSSETYEGGMITLGSKSKYQTPNKAKTALYSIPGYGGYIKAESIADPSDPSKPASEILIGVKRASMLTMIPYFIIAVAFGLLIGFNNGRKNKNKNTVRTVNKKKK